MKKDAELHPVGFFEKRPVLRRSQRLTADVAEQDDPVEFQRINRTVQFFERFVRRVHWNRSEPFKSFWILGDEFGIRVVDHSSDCRLMLRASKENVWR